ncbi:MAG TPA: hypothetical protein V6C93_10340 [Allocoleopsis sp.]
MIKKQKTPGNRNGTMGKIDGTYLVRPSPTLPAKPTRWVREASSI